MIFDELLKKINMIVIFLNELKATALQNDKQFAAEKNRLEEEAKNLKAVMKIKYDNYKTKYFDYILNNIKRLETDLNKDYSYAYRPIETIDNYNYEETEKYLLDSTAKLNELIQKLNAVDYDTLVPPIKVGAFTKATEDKVVDTRPLKNLAGEIYNYCDKVKNAVKRMKKLFDRRFDIEDFYNSIDEAKTKEIGRIYNTMQDIRTAKIDAFFSNDVHNNFPDKFFNEIEEEGKRYYTDINKIPTTYNSKITIGNIKINYSTGIKDFTTKDAILVVKNHVLRKHLDNIYFKYPLILDLKNQGNILIDVNEIDYSTETKNFVNQLIIQFLLSFPVGRINFCLVDIDDKMDFSSFKSLTKINNNILMNGIVRDDRQLENTIKDMEQLMYRINDDILSYNNVDNIYEYNEKFDANPQNVHLFVLSNFPSGIRDDLAKRIEKIVKNGPKSGIFTIIVNNYSCKLGYNFKENEYMQLLDNISKNAFCITKKKNGFELNVNKENKISLFNEINVNELSRIISMIKDNGATINQKVISLQQMFDSADEAVRSKNYSVAAEVIDIPIGARGGEIQNIMLKTIGAGDVHTVLIGSPGSGKSNLLHTIIMSACYKYSPEDLNLYLIDFKGGVEFKYYEANKNVSNQLPHIKLIGLTNDLEDGVAILNNLKKELENRISTLKSCGVPDIYEYNKLGYKLPRLFVIIDEIQELFERDDKLGQKAIDILSSIFKLGRAFGINILWASQNVPKVPGLKDKILNQIGNRISLRLNEPDDALDIKIDPKVVRSLNRPEKGLGVINDLRYGNDSYEFRVAYAENSENRKKFSKMIIDKWRNVTSMSKQEPLYIVGDVDEPSPILGNTLYTAYNENVNLSNIISDYRIQLGQDYVSGKPFNIDILMRKEGNILIAGTEYNMLEDMMGYAVLSVLANNRINRNFIKDKNIYYSNGEIVNYKNQDNLFNVIRDELDNHIIKASSMNGFKDAIADVYKLYKDRVIKSRNSESYCEYTPYFMIINGIQNYVDLFDENPVINLNEHETVNNNTELSSLDMAKSMFASVSKPASSNVRNANVSLLDAFKELLDKGSRQGIYFIISIDNPFVIQALKAQFSGFNYKILVKGINQNVASQLIGEYRISDVLNNSRVALVTTPSERSKIRVYRFGSKDRTWYNSFKNRIK